MTSKKPNLCTEGVTLTIFNIVSCLDAHLKHTNLPSEVVQRRLLRCIEDELKFLPRRLAYCQEYAEAYEEKFFK